MEPILGKDAWRNWKCFTIKIKHEELPVLNQRLKLYGYNTMTELTRDFITGKFPVITEDRQIHSIESNIQANGLKTLVKNVFVEPTFYTNTDLDDMRNYLINIRKLHERNASSLVSYFRRYCDMFFGPDPSEIMQQTPHIRMWILQAMRQFGNYYNYKTNNPECKELIEKIINRFALNVKTDLQHRIYIVDDNFIAEKIKKLMAVQGDVGFTIKVGLYSGLREDEIIYCYNMETCDNLGGCSCSKLHVVNKPNGMTVIVVNWFRGHKKCHFTIMPTKIWLQFRALHTFSQIDIETAHKVCKSNAAVRFMDLRKLHYNVMCRVMEMYEADILAGRAKSVAARHYAMYEMDKMADKYLKGWQVHSPI
jgi:intergrase/recombinase